MASFVVNMATAFEDFVTTALTESVAGVSSGRTHGQFRTHLDHAEWVPIRPDVVHTLGAAPVAVFDAKYKLGTTDDGYPTADVYQMLAYCPALQLDRGYLIYAGSRAEGVNVSELRIRNTDVSVVTWPLDVAVAPGQLLDQVARVGATAVAPTIRRSPAG